MIKELISHQKISEKNIELAKKISNDFQNKPLTIISILKGSFIFTADLIRLIETKNEIEIYFVQISSYKGTEQIQKPKIAENIKDIDIKNKNILIIEDIIDSGKTLKTFIEKLKKFNPNMIKICTLLDKKICRNPKIKIDIDYFGFEIKNDFVVGYGLDFEQKYRNLNFIGILEK